MLVSKQNLSQIGRLKNVQRASVRKDGMEFGLAESNTIFGGVSKSMLKQSRLNFDKIEKCE
ncbi:hypothetical protein APD06_02765 [Acinetobacter baumannii]|uniref:Uncharacterized protein n=1 Tax=Acinetobacter baumannii TaxID=470 RepID=A0AB73FG21_ACIBA|nr:hypothetical protein APD06_02765 [Acinetobacter baumannii]